jgi:hypothetical protein
MRIGEKTWSYNIFSFVLVKKLRGGKMVSERIGCVAHLLRSSEYLVLRLQTSLFIFSHLIFSAYVLV